MNSMFVTNVVVVGFPSHRPGRAVRVSGTGNPVFTPSITKLAPSRRPHWSIGSPRAPQATTRSRGTPVPYSGLDRPWLSDFGQLFCEAAGIQAANRINLAAEGGRGGAARFFTGPIIRWSPHERVEDMMSILANGRRAIGHPEPWAGPKVRPRVDVRKVSGPLAKRPAAGPVPRIHADVPARRADVGAPGPKDERARMGLEAP